MQTDCRLRVALLLFVGSLIAGCGQAATPIHDTPLHIRTKMHATIPFRVELQDDSNWTQVPLVDPEHGPMVAVISDASQIDALDVVVNDEHLERLRDVDYVERIVIVIFRGIRGTTEYSLSLDEMRIRGFAVVLSCTFIDPGPDQPTGQLMTSPIEVVSIRRADLPVGISTFVMLDRGIEVYRLNHELH